MRYLSVCSGIEAASVAWHPLGWEPVAFSEIEAFPSAVLAERWPHVPNRGDMERFGEWPDADTDLLVGGTPCQSNSVGAVVNAVRKIRAGLADPRGQLAVIYLAIVDRYRPRWFLWENVPGVLSVNGGQDFAALIGAMVELGCGIAWRVLDARYFKCASSRPRVFVVGHTGGDWRLPAAVLFQQESLAGYRPASEGEAAIVAAPVLTARGAMAYDDRTPCVLEPFGPRRATPLEWERALGFPDNHTLINFRGRPAADGPRYKSLGNSMPVPVMRWIGRRIEMVDALADELGLAA